MRILLSILAGFIIISFSNYINSTPIKDVNINYNSKVILEGILQRGDGGGTREMFDPIGYILRDPIWIVKPQFNLEDKIILISSYNLPMKNYVNKYVHVEGELFDIPTKKIGEVRFIYSHYKIDADTIYIVK